MIDGSRIELIADAIANTFNLVLYGSGAVFIIMIFWSSYKYAISLGDAKALEGAKQSLTHAIYGFLIVVGFFFMVSFATSYMGLSNVGVSNPAGMMRQNLLRLVDIVNTSGNDLVIPCAQKGFCVIEGN